MPPLAAGLGMTMAELMAATAAVGTGVSVGKMGYDVAQGGPGAGPDPMIAAKAAQDAADKSRLRGVVTRSTTDAQTRTSGGASPEFLANVATQEAGTPNMQGEALDMVKKLLAGGGA